MATVTVTSRAFPSPDDLAWRERFGIHATATADIALRTAAATLVAATTVPQALHPREFRADVARLDFYRELGRAADPREVFPAPDAGIEMQVAGDRRVPRRWRGDGRVRDLRFDSPFVPLHPELRVPYLEHGPNGSAWAQHWTHDDSPRPTIMVVHGFMASPYWVNRMFLQLPWLYGHGYDILLVTLPFHGRRRDSPLHYSGAGLFTGGISQLNEVIAHGVHDLRAWVDLLVSWGVPRIGMTGISLGGYMTALLASVDDRLSFAIPNVPVVRVSDLMASWVPAGWLVRGAMRLAGKDLADLGAAMALHSPLTWAPLVPHERRFVIAGLGDRLSPPSQARALWEHWGRPYVHWFSGNHILHVDQGAYLRQVGRFLQAIEFA